MSEEKKFLSQPLSIMVPQGYQGCLDCGLYFHHQTIWCPKCGQKIIRHKEISIGNFIAITRKGGGAGPMNTLYYYLKRHFNKEGDPKYKLGKKPQKIYAAARKWIIK